MWGQEEKRAEGTGEDGRLRGKKKVKKEGESRTVKTAHCQECQSPKSRQREKEFIPTSAYKKEQALFQVGLQRQQKKTKTQTGEFFGRGGGGGEDTVASSTKKNH